MYSAAILGIALLVSPTPGARDGASPASGSKSAQAPAATQEKPATDAPATADTKPSESKPEETPSDKKASDSQTAPSDQPATGARKRRSRTKKPVATSESEPRKIVVRHGGAGDPVVQILPGISQEEAERQRESAEQLLTASDSSLKELTTHSLNTHQQDTVVQIRQYMDVARSALQESDIQRAHTLALKAYLLADDLVKHEE